VNKASLLAAMLMLVPSQALEHRDYTKSGLDFDGMRNRMVRGDA